MKKLAIFSVLLLAFSGYMNVATAAEDCEPVDLLTANKVNSVERLQIGSGQYLICDADVGPNECKYNTVVLYNNTAVYCKDIGGTAVDEWVPADNISDCPDNLSTYTIVGDYAIQDITKWKARGNGAYILDSKKWTYRLGNICKIKKNVVTTKQCPYNNQSYDVGMYKPDSCADMRKKDAKIKAAAEVCQADGTWSACKVISCVDGKAPVNNACPGSGNGGGTVYINAEACRKLPASVATWNVKTLTCDCVDQTKRYDRASNSCVAKTGLGNPDNPVNPGTPVVTVFSCDSMADMAWVREMQVKYANNKTISDYIAQILKFCADAKRNESDFNNYITQLRILIQRMEQQQAEDNKRDQSDALERINNALASINMMRTGYESDASVWKTSEGKFNTTRLVSDSVAGVVLGTAGGLITSNVIKKNQIKGGFEDISCAIGGQVVAGWSDEFSVGIR
ncbi:MAG: hypothetical protein LBF37_03860 [Rickettsiales bacterium]|jgi:hypothetical protein|nr:hypothetical protein [Rickettsiales bacterium]